MRNVLWVIGWAGGLWGAGLVMRTGNFALALLLLVFSLGLLWARAGISSLSALIRFSLNPSIPAAKVTNSFNWGCYLFGYNLSLTIIGAIFVAFPMKKYLGASFTPKPELAWAWVVAPVVEELTFRLPLKYTAINLSVPALIVTLFTVRGLLLKFRIFTMATATDRWLWSAVFAILLASVVLILLRTEPVKRLASRIWLNHSRLVVYVSCFAFGLLHIANFRFTTLSAETLTLAPLLVLPQIVSGFILAFTRVHLGMIWCIVLHAANNFLAYWLFSLGPR